jgi:hypothetical protein
MDVDTIALTTNNAPSSYSTASPYSVPVAVIDGQTYGPADIVMGTGKQAGELVREWAERFCGQWPEATSTTEDLIRRANMLPEALHGQILEILRMIGEIAERKAAEAKP